jgi:hypothetical protein
VAGVEAVMSGMPLLVVAQNLGHSDTRNGRQHYGHLARRVIGLIGFGRMGRGSALCQMTDKISSIIAHE